MAFLWLVDMDAPLADQPGGASGTPRRYAVVVIARNGGYQRMYDNNPELQRRLSSW